MQSSSIEVVLGLQFHDEMEKVKILLNIQSDRKIEVYHFIRLVEVSIGEFEIRFINFCAVGTI